MRSVPPAVAGGPNDWKLSTGDSDWRIAIKPIGNRQSQIDNPQTHPLPQVVLTSSPKLGALFQLELFKLPQFCVRQKNVKRDVAAKNESAPTVEKALQPEIAMNEDQPGPEDH